MKILIRFAFGIILVLTIGLIAIKVFFGMGAFYPSVATSPTRTDVEVAIELPFPPGMVTAGAEGRIFFTYHPFHRPEVHTSELIFEWQDGQRRPVAPELSDRLHGVFGITVDAFGRLWAVRPGAMEGRPTEVLALDPDTGSIVYEHLLPDDIGGFAQDLRVSEDGRWVYLADTGLFRFTSPALIILDTETNQARAVLQKHESTAPQKWVMRKTDGSAYRLGYGLLNFQVGLDGIELTADDKWLIFAAMTHDSVYRVPTVLLTDFTTPEDQISSAVEWLGPAPMSDGIALATDGSILLTDVENGGLSTLSTDGRLATLVALEEVDWADSVTVAPNGDIWFTDSRLTALLDAFARPPSLDEIEADAPFAIYRLPAR